MKVSSVRVLCHFSGPVDTLGFIPEMFHFIPCIHYLSEYLLSMIELEEEKCQYPQISVSCSLHQQGRDENFGNCH